MPNTGTSAITTTKLLIDDDGRYSTIEAATYLGLQPTTLRNARWSGKLCGTQSPRFIKYGSKVVYTGRTLREWREQFEYCPNTSTEV